MWSVAALGLTLLLTPLLVSMCHSLSALTRRGAHRILATNRGAAELEHLRGGAAAPRAYAVPELPSGRCEVVLTAAAASRLREARVTVTWDEGGRIARAEWVTLVPGGQP